MDLHKSTPRPGAYSLLTALTLLALVLPAASVAQVFDESFNATVGHTASHGVGSIALQPDGKILIGGTFTTVNGITRRGLARLNPDGSIDPGFDTSVLAADVGAIAVQEDGKILVGGTLSAIQGLAATELVRLNPDGSTDLAFNPRVAGPVHDILVLPDGDMLVAGQFSSVNGVTLGTEGNLVRLNGDGTRDRSLRAVVHGAATDFVNAVAIHPDGKIVVGGSFAVTVNGVALRRHLARLNADGSLHTLFGGTTSPSGVVLALAVRPDNKILVGGIFDSVLGGRPQSRKGIVQLNANGSLDTGFTPDFNVGTRVNALALQPDGRVWVGGAFDSVDGHDERRIARLNLDGSLDLTFGPFPVTTGGVLAIALQPDGKPIIGGTFSGPAAGHADIARLLPAPLPQMSFDKTKLRFGAVTNGSMLLTQTPAQVVQLTQSGSDTVTWTATSDQPWLQISPASGSGPASLRISVVDVGGLPMSGVVSASITFAFTGVSTSTGSVAATLTLIPDGTSAAAFGSVDTPTENRTGVTGAVPFTGWALDDVEVTRVMICRAGFGAEVVPVDPNCGGAAQIFIGFAVFIDGARPDVQAAFPESPMSNRGGWGFMVQTNSLPGQGNGTYQFFVHAQDHDGHTTLLGTRTMTCANASATLPFGTIDTPEQGGLASGTSYVNFGWALTQAGKFIPTDGSTIVVMVDGAAVGTADYNHFRADIAALFPGLANSNGAVGFRILDTTGLTNGLHTISWRVTDNLGNTDGIGHRFFRVSNGVGSSTTTSTASLRVAEIADERVRPDVVLGVAADVSPVLGRRGWDPDGPWQQYAIGSAGGAVIRGEELDRFELLLEVRAGERYMGYLRVGTGLAKLPVGSRLDAETGAFTWAPGAGFVGTYDLVFVRWAQDRAIARRDVRVIIAPKGRGHVGPQVEIDTPWQNQDVAGAFVLAGWAADLDASSGTGIDTLHVWAYPIAGGPPLFVGTPTLNGTRPDVAAVHGDRFRESGFALVVQGLAHGTYDVAIFPWSNVTGGFAPAKVVRVTVR